MCMYICINDTDAKIPFITLWPDRLMVCVCLSLLLPPSLSLCLFVYVCAYDKYIIFVCLSVFKIINGLD